MKITIPFVAAAALLSTAWNPAKADPPSPGGGYSLLRVCEDQAVVHGSDGSDCGHIGYVALDPESHQVVSVLVSGGVLADRYVAVPMDSVQFGGGGTFQVTLTNITQQTIVNAPVIEHTSITRNFIEPGFIEKDYQHFGVSTSRLREGGTSERGHAEVNRNEGRNEPSRPGEVNRNAPPEGAAATRRGDVNAPEGRADTRNRGEPNAEGAKRRPDSQAEQRNQGNEPNKNERAHRPGEESPGSGQKAESKTESEGKKNAEPRSNEENSSTKRKGQQPDENGKRPDLSHPQDEPPHAKKSDENGTGGNARRPEGTTQEKPAATGTERREGESNANKEPKASHAPNAEGGSGSSTGINREEKPSTHEEQPRNRSDESSKARQGSEKSAGESKAESPKSSRSEPKNSGTSDQERKSKSSSEPRRPE